MLSKRIMLPLAAIVCFFAYKALGAEGDTLYFVPLFAFLMLLTVVFLLKQPIDWWWVQKHPPALPPPLDRLLRQAVPYYALLDGEEQRRFHDRVSLFSLRKEFESVGKEKETRPDLQGLIAAQAVQLTFGIKRNDYLMERYAHVVLYPHPFPSPAMKFLHSTEINEDGVLIFDAERALAGMLQPNKYYNLVLHEWGNAFYRSNMGAQFPRFETSAWGQLERIRGMDKAYILTYTGLEEVDIVPVSIEHFFMSPLLFQQIMPDVYGLYTKIFNQNPLRTSSPVLDKGILETRKK
jgi:Mlc titration factor MtfA (ptsG expression regulator)